jgi:thiamine transport system ATP-binding protein
MLTVRDVVIRYGDHVAVDHVDLDAQSGEVVCVLGPSGGGKSSLLRAIAGLEPPAEGRVAWDDVDLASTPPHRRRFGLMFQDHALFPHRDVAANVGFGLRMRGDADERVSSRTTELLELVGLAGFERRSVGSLSGGEQQRLALARALAPEPRVLLLDEPLGSLDRRLRDRLLEDLGRLFDELALTAVYVTHDQTEAFTLGDRVAVMRAGHVVQVASPDELWAHPIDADVARFLGLANIDGDEVIRPEAVTVRPSPAGNATIERAVRTGPLVRLRVALDDGRSLDAAVTAVAHPEPGDRVDVTIDPEGIVRLR